MLSKELWETSGHWKNYRDNMYVSEIDEKEYAIKPMNCPGSMLVYKNEFYSYKDLPIRMGELGSVHRHEASGALSGLFRVRNFTQDDAHIYCTPEQLESEVKEIVKLFDFFYKKVFHIEYDVYLSTRPEEKYIGTLETWEKSEKALGDALTAMGKTFKINPGDGAFYGPKLDFKLNFTTYLRLDLIMRFPDTVEYLKESGLKSAICALDPELELPDVISALDV
jgi:threonyl-tRNA synthetase